ncbi:hypothetical protein PWT90_09434 [Aphanocladium album]|nr:hypothetical protein PWT90_09434 [Aphanocladium album]
MKPSKHSRQQSESATASRRRETQNRNNLAQAQVYQQRLPTGTATYYPEQDVYDVYHASTSVLPQQQYQYQQVGQDLRRSASTGGWSMQEEVYQQQQAHEQEQPQQHPQQQQQQQQQQQPSQTQQKQQQKLLKHAEAKALLDARHRPSSGAWSMRDDHQLITARKDGLNWSQIQEQFFPGKSSNACRKRHERLIDSKGRGGSDESQRMERIAAEYVQMREKLWRPLADKTGEKWTYVERTCLSHGLKNLQGTARAANRKHRFDPGTVAAAAAAAAAAAGYDDDSGISGIGLTPVDEVDMSVAYSSSPAPPSPLDAVHSSANAAQSFTSTTTPAYLAHPHQLAQAHLHPAAYSNLIYGGGAATQYHPQHAYSSSISSEGSLHPGYASRRGHESA